LARSAARAVSYSPVGAHLRDAGAVFPDNYIWAILCGESIVKMMPGPAPGYVYMYELQLNA
jgi:ABC-type sugar transport system substrate-binding protein